MSRDTPRHTKTERRYLKLWKVPHPDCPRGSRDCTPVLAAFAHQLPPRPSAMDMVGKLSLSLWLADLTGPCFLPHPP